MGVQLPSEPINRQEQYLAKIAGQAVEIPTEPITREEAYLDAIAKGSGGGGGGTKDYSQLDNKPQINGNTLIGNKTASQLGLASTADLAGKVDKVEGKGLSTNDYTDADKAIVDGVTAALSNKQDTLTFDDVPIANSDNPVKSGGVKSAIDAAVASAYHHAGTKTCAELVAGLLVAGNEGNVYNMTDSGTTTSDFIEGAGQPIKAGDNVGIAKISDGVYKFDLLSGFVDTSNFVQKSETAGLLKNDGTVDTTIQGNVSSLMSGLTNVQDDVKLNTNDLTTPSRTANIAISTSSDSTDVSQYSVALYVDCDLKPNTTYTLSFDGTNSAKYYSNENLFANQSIVTVGSERVVMTVTTKSSISKTGSTFISGKGWIILKNSITEPEGHAFTDVQFELGSTATSYAPYIPSVDARLEAVESNLLYLGKGTQDFKKTVYCGYISGSGNYLDFFVPCKYDNTISTVTLNNSALMSIYTFDGTLLTQGYIDFTVVSLEKTIGGLRIELKFNNTQTTYINTIANIAFGNDSVFTFA